MAATISQIESAIQAAWDAGWTLTPAGTVWAANVAFDPTTLAPGSFWVETDIAGGPMRAMTADDVFVGTPTLTVTVHTPLGTGMTAAAQMLDAATAIYQGISLVAGTSTLRPYSFSRPVEVPRDGWFNVSMQISFRMF